jgi:hypothetical protein
VVLGAAKKWFFFELIDFEIVTQKPLLREIEREKSMRFSAAEALSSFRDIIRDRP